MVQFCERKFPYWAVQNSYRES